jgi:hypothetical protein
LFIQIAGKNKKTIHHHSGMHNIDKKTLKMFLKCKPEKDPISTVYILGQM